MTQEELKAYSELQEKFADDVLRVIAYLREIDENFEYVDEFQLISTNQVKIHGWEYGAFQYQKEHYGYFDAEMLTWTDDELKKYIEKIKKCKEEECAHKEIKNARRKEDEERSLWEKLNEKFGKK